MTTAANKYKDRSPKDTIQIITKFFNNLDLNIKEQDVFMSECGTWSCKICLFTENEQILVSNGKGAEKDFALASGYAELFERFCNKNRLFMQPIVMSLTTELNKNSKGYYLHPEEKKISFEDFKTKSPALYNLYLRFFGNDENIRLFFSIYIQENIIGVPMKNCFNDQIIYEDIRLWQKMFGSSALSAGNTLEEALIQGISELFEHYAYEQFFKNPHMEYYEVSLNCLNPNGAASQKIKQLPAHKKFRLFDLSYNFQVPVCLGIIIDNKNLNISFDFGSAPTFEIATERVITELYQLRTKSDDYNLNLRSIHYDAHWSIYVRETLGFPPTADTWPLWFTFNSKKVNNYNAECFLSDKSYTNKQFLDFYQKIAHKLDFDLYYYNSSPIKDFFAIQIISYNKPYLTFRSELVESQQLTVAKRHDFLLSTLRYMQNFISIIHGEHNAILNTYQIKEHLQLKISGSYGERFFLGYLEGSNWHQPLLENTETPFYFNSTKTILNIEELYEVNNEYYKDNNKKYLMLYDFKKQGVFTDEEIKKLFNNFGIVITDTELQNILNPVYFFYITVIQTLRELYSLPSLNRMIEAYHKIC